MQGFTKLRGMLDYVEGLPRSTDFYYAECSHCLIGLGRFHLGVAHREWVHAYLEKDIAWWDVHLGITPEQASLLFFRLGAEVDEYFDLRDKNAAVKAARSLINRWEKEQAKAEAGSLLKRIKDAARHAFSPRPGQHNASDVEVSEEV
jgi:hypothetical protein